VVDDAPPRRIPQRLGITDIIGQAKGVIMERFNLDAVEAFDLLARRGTGVVSTPTTA
jgi:hypothetical protein